MHRSTGVASQQTRSDIKRSRSIYLYLYLFIFNNPRQTYQVPVLAEVSPSTNRLIGTERAYFAESTEKARDPQSCTTALQITAHRIVSAAAEGARNLRT
eukprot:792389-Pelagomonas_calceolata.AAC.1